MEIDRNYLKKMYLDSHKLSEEIGKRIDEAHLTQTKRSTLQITKLLDWLEMADNCKHGIEAIFEDDLLNLKSKK